MSTPIKKKPLTKTEVKVLQRLRNMKQSYGYQFRSERKKPYSSIIEDLIAKGLAHEPEMGKWGIMVRFAEITDAGRKALEEASK
jgi:hypothetical protein